ncbi:DUF5132 domain-containing protein [Sagittula salina]|uniref:DUF5132 domain-containing protein n=1 Tax=Sagittula salina TaxID=2820268 RepID=A0A940MYI0_9RHOB|nr:DUF5132 domain-containing protein [Sagittula salina]MBP0485159.1 DUF5132 domain-containing protein [Sagittula salina]
MNKNFLLGTLVTAGAALLIPGVAQAVGRAGRPLVRAAMRSGSTAFEEFGKAGAEAYEHIEDIVAEIREENEARRRAAAETAASEAASPKAAAGAGHAD